MVAGCGAPPKARLIASLAQSRLPTVLWRRRFRRYVTNSSLAPKTGLCTCPCGFRSDIGPGTQEETPGGTLDPEYSLLPIPTRRGWSLSLAFRGKRSRYDPAG